MGRGRVGSGKNKKWQEHALASDVRIELPTLHNLWSDQVTETPRASWVPSA